MLALLRSLGVPIDRPEDARRLLQEQRTGALGRYLEPVLVHRIGRGGLLSATIPMGVEADSVWLSLELEDGTTCRQGWASVAAPSATAGGVALGGSRRVHFDLETWRSRRFPRDTTTSRSRQRGSGSRRSSWPHPTAHWAGDSGASSSPSTLYGPSTMRASAPTRTWVDSATGCPPSGADWSEPCRCIRPSWSRRPTRARISPSRDSPTTSSSSIPRSSPNMRRLRPLDRQQWRGRDRVGPGRLRGGGQAATARARAAGGRRLLRPVPRSASRSRGLRRDASRTGGLRALPGRQRGRVARAASRTPLPWTITCTPSGWPANNSPRWPTRGAGTPTFPSDPILTDSIPPGPPSPSSRGCEGARRPTASSPAGRAGVSGRCIPSACEKTGTGSSSPPSGAPSSTPTACASTTSWGSNACT